MGKLRIFFIAVPLSAILIAGAIYFVNPANRTRGEVVIVIPQNPFIRNFDTNYYKQWLEEQTGLSIRFNTIYEANTADYLRSMFASGYVQSDAFFDFLSDEDSADRLSILQEFGEKGYIIPLDGFIEQSIYLNAIIEEYPEYDWHTLKSPDGKIYFMPALDPSMPESHFQVLWLNLSWLKNLRLSIPQTTEELREVLYAFKTRDPNGNNRNDEIPLAGSRDAPAGQSYQFIINAFVYNDPANSHLFIEDGVVRFAPMTGKWREAMIFLHELYADGLLSPFEFTTEHYGLAALANDPQNILGGFTSKSVTDVIFPTNPEIITNFIHIAPIAGPDGARNATAFTPFPRPAGVITSNCENPEAVFRLFDLMLSEEAFLIGRFGEKGVDWIPAHITDTDLYGGIAKIRVINQLRNIVQNKHFNETGPFFAYPRYADSVTFSAFEANQEYVNARAYRVYQQYKPKEYIRGIYFDGGAQEFQTLRQAVDEYTEESIEAFVTGGKDPFDDAVWESHENTYRTIGIDTLIHAVQTMYDFSN